MSKMKFNAVCCACVLLAAPLLAQAQASGESAETGPSEARQGGRGATRSALWLAVEAHFRQPDGAPAAPDRRLTSEQRHQLREQVRRATERQQAVPPGDLLRADRR